MEKILLIDGNSIINRAFYGLPILTNKDGEYTNAVYGFMNIFFRLFDEAEYTYAAVAFDRREPTFRHEKTPDYKGTRKPMPDELRPQIPLLKSLLTKMNICAIDKIGYEADDLLGTLAAKAEAAGLLPTVVSGDRDLLQTATDKTLVRIPKTKGGKTVIEDYYAKDVKEILGVTPAEYIDVKALMGDKSDNIAGVAGIGDKTAVSIIQTYGNIENAVEWAKAEAANNPKAKKVMVSLAGAEEILKLSRFLCEICKSAPVELNLAQMRVRDMYNPIAFEEIKRLNFKKLASRFVENDIHEKVMEMAEATKEPAKIAASAFFISVIFGELFGVSIFDENGARFIKTKDIHECGDFFESDAPKIAMDSKKDIVYLRKHGIALKNIIFDATLAGYLLNSSKQTYNYDDLAFDYLNESLPSFASLEGKGKERKKKLEDFDEEVLTKYTEDNARVLYNSCQTMRNELLANGEKELYETVELPLAAVLADMELLGIRVDKSVLVKYGAALQEHITALEESIYETCGEVFNINSPSQLGVVLFEHLKLPHGKKSKTGYSTAADILSKLRYAHPAVSKILEYRTCTKLKSTYADALIPLIDKTTEKITSTFHQTVTETGRISSSEPNLQNIPIRLEMGRELRKAFIPSEGYVFMSADYSQIELRVLAHMSGDPVLIEAFAGNSDIHTLTASQVFKVPIESVTQDQRRAAKAVNFGIIYGIGAHSLSEDLNISRQDADKYIKDYFLAYPSIKKYLDGSVEFAKEHGYAKTIFGRRREIPELSESNFFTRAFGERAAMNMPVQGTAADIIKKAMIGVYNALRGKKSRVILQIHDELLLEVHKDEKQEILDIVKNEMEHAASLSVPLPVDIHFGDNWYDAK
ncbi:DNA polymerase [Clostridia bacterium]|nr:DNA polymerase [Clostridia bacterium]